MEISSMPLGALAANCYFLKEKGEVAVIDPGSWEPALERRVREHQAEIKLILLTHRHADHLMGAARLKELTGAPVAIHADDAAGLYDPVASLSQFMWTAGSVSQSPLHADLLLQDGQELTFGGRAIRVLHTPGHSAGGVCYLVDDLLFSGDTLFAGNAGRTDLPTGDYTRLKASLERLRDLPGDYRVYPGHGEPTTLSQERRSNPYLGTDYDDTFDI